MAIIFTIFISFTGIHSQNVFAKPELNIDAKAAILVDVIQGKILYSKESDIPLQPASMTKMMTEYLILEAISSGKIKWDDVVTASEYAHWMGKDGGSRVFLALGEKRTVKELMYAMAVYSANDATVALAEYLSGSETNFVNLMNEKAKEFGMTQTHFLNSTGFPEDQLGEYTPSVTGDHLMSAKDAATLGWHLIHDYPEILTFTSTPKIKFREEQPNPMNLPNWNWMLPGLIYEYQGIDGLKTGSTEAAGYNFTATAERNGVRFISVVMGTSSTANRFAQTKILMDYAFANFEAVDLLKAKEKVPGYEILTVKEGKKREVSVMTKNNLSVLIKKGEESLYKPTAFIEEEITTPIKAGDQLGYLGYEYTGSEHYDFLNEEIQKNSNVGLIAEEDVEKASFFRLFFRKIFDIIGGIFTGIIEGIKGIF